MSKAVLVAILGVIVTLLPLSGLPSAFIKIAVMAIGVALLVLGLLMRAERLWMVRALSGGHKTDTYAENAAPQKNTTDRT